MNELNKMKKIVVLDFDGVFSSSMLYDKNGKALKSFTWGIRYAIDELVHYGFEIYIITGDSTGNGVEISKTFTKNLKIKEFITCSAKDKLNYILKRFGKNIYFLYFTRRY
jgi:3-deoxy-D-manno-octulosonate 8-phosphate phosphatase KdsC-like HAD superfamily phosphatase